MLPSPCQKPLDDCTRLPQFACAALARLMLAPVGQQLLRHHETRLACSTAALRQCKSCPVALWEFYVALPSPTLPAAIVLPVYGQHLPIDPSSLVAGLILKTISTTIRRGYCLV